VLGGDASRTVVTDGPPKIRLAATPAKRKIKPIPVDPSEVFAVIPAAVAYDPDIHPAAIRILIAMAHHANMHGVTHVSQARIATLVGIQRPTVCKHIATLAEHLYIAKLRPAEKGKRGITWRIVYDREAAAEYRKLITPHIKGKFAPMNANKSLRERKKETKAKKESSTIDERLRTMVIERYAAEGLPPPSEALIAESVADLMRQCPEIASEQPTAHDQVSGKGDIA
jgi:DNA-binding MarR family transcriptional regulator